MYAAALLPSRPWLAVVGTVLSACLFVSGYPNDGLIDTSKESETMRKAGSCFVPLAAFLMITNVETSLADSKAHALWALGVQIGFAELGSDQNVAPRLLQETLTLALDAAKQLDCIPQDTIDKITTLQAKMLSATNSRPLYSKILALRTDVAGVVSSSCVCDGDTTSHAPACEQSDWVGTWDTTWNKMRLSLQSDGTLAGVYNTRTRGSSSAAFIPAASSPRRSSVRKPASTMGGPISTNVQPQKPFCSLST